MDGEAIFLLGTAAVGLMGGGIYLTGNAVDSAYEDYAEEVSQEYEYIVTADTLDEASDTLGEAAHELERYSCGKHCTHHPDREASLTELESAHLMLEGIWQQDEVSYLDIELLDHMVLDAKGNLYELPDEQKEEFYQPVHDNIRELEGKTAELESVYTTHLPEDIAAERTSRLNRADTLHTIGTVLGLGSLVVIGAWAKAQRDY